MTRTLTLIVCCGLAACANGGPSSSTSTEPFTESSPLGPGYPDPQATVVRVLEAMESRDFEGMCRWLCGPGRRGAPVPLIPGRNLPEIPDEREELWTRVDVAGLRSFIAQPWKQIHYGSVKSLRNDPPMIAVPIRVRYDWERIPATEREMLVRTTSHRMKRSVSWEEIVTQGRRREAAEASATRPLPVLRFAHFQDGWRLYLGP